MGRLDGGIPRVASTLSPYAAAAQVGLGSNFPLLHVPSARQVYLNELTNPATRPARSKGARTEQILLDHPRAGGFRVTRLAWLLASVMVPTYEVDAYRDQDDGDPIGHRRPFSENWNGEDCCRRWTSGPRPLRARAAESGRALRDSWGRLIRARWYPPSHDALLPSELDAKIGLGL